jgi:predicted DNA binding CopG/RHH family protein
MKKLPKHRSEDEEREFWAKSDSTDYIDWKAARRVRFSKLKPSLRTISLRLPEMMIEELKLLSNKMDVPYQTLIKIYLSERIQKELKIKGFEGSRGQGAK